MKCLLSWVVYSSERIGFPGFSILYFPRTLYLVLHPIINSTWQWPWFAHSHQLHPVLLNKFLFSRSHTFFPVTFSISLFSFFFCFSWCPFCPPSFTHHVTLLHEERIVRLSRSCLCACPVHHLQWPLTVTRKKKKDKMFFRHLKAARQCPLFFNVKRELVGNKCWKWKKVANKLSLVEYEKKK